MNFKTVLTSASLALVFASGVQAANPNLVLNPSFESPDIGMPVAGSMYTSSVANWLTTGNPTVLFNSTYRAVSDQFQAVQIERNSDMLSQSFTTIASQQYTLSFDFSTWWLSDLTKVSTLLVQAGDLSQTITGTGPAYTPQSFTFTAQSNSTTLSFTNTGPTFVSYPQIDNVSVTAVPEPGTYAMLLAGLAAVGFLAKRRSA